MSKVFGIILILVFSVVGHAHEQELLSEKTLMHAVESSLDATARCHMFLAPLGNAMGKEIGLWWRKRQIRNDYITPLFEKVQTLKSEVNAQENIVREVEFFEVRLLEQSVFKKCPEKTEEFFKNVRAYIEFTTVQVSP